MSVTLKLFNNFIVRDLIKNWGRTAITLLGIVIGVSVVVAINSANHSVLGKFRQSVDLVAGKANLEIRPVSAIFFDQSVLQDLTWLSQIGGKYTPLIKESALFPGKPGEFVQLLGVDVLADPDFISYAESNQSSGDEIQNAPGKADDPTGLLNEDPSHTVFIGDKLAKRHGLKAGSELDLIINDSLQHFVVTGVLAASGLGGAYCGDLIIIDIDSAQAALGIPGKVSQIEIIAPDKDLDAVRERLTALLPANLTVATPKQHGKQVQKMTASFEFNLNSLSFIALIVGMLLIYNTMTISIIRRRADIGTLRALGLSRWRVMLLFGLEAIAYGVIGTSIGIVCGLFLGQLALKAVSETIQYFYFQIPIDTIVLNWKVIITAFFFGTGLTVIAAVPPVIEASCVTPAEATRRSSHDLKIHRLAGKMAIAGIIFILLTAMAILQPALGNQPVYGHLATLLAMISGMLVTPLILKIILAGLSTPSGKIIGAEGKIAVRSLYGALGRTAVAVGSLMVGIAMMVCLTIMINSFRVTVQSWLDQTFKANLWLEPVARIKGNKTARLSLNTVAKLSGIANIAALEPFLELPIIYQGDPAILAAVDFNVRSQYGQLTFTSGESTKSVCSRIHNNQAIVSETFAVKRNIHKGDELIIPSPQGHLRLQVEGIFYNYTSDLGYIIIPQGLYQNTFHNDPISSCAIYLKPGANPETVRAEILRRIGANVPITIRTTGELHEEAMKIFDTTFAVVYALDMISIAVAMLVITNSLFALTLESRRDFGILRYLGASQSQLKTIVLMQAGVLGCLGNIWGLGLGFALALFLIHIVNKQSFGWTVRMSIPFDFVVQSSILLIATAIVAGLIPARLAARTIAPEVVRDE